MLDLKTIRDNPDLVKSGAAKKRIAVDIDRLLELDTERRGVGQRVDELRSQQKSAGKAIAKATPEERAKLLEEQKTLKVELKALEERVGVVETELHELHIQVPNIPDEAVPEGKSDQDNVELRKMGTPPVFDFEPLDHIDIGTRQGWLDIEAGARLAGSRNFVLLGDMALLERAIMCFCMDHMLAKGFELLHVPMLVRREPLLGTGYFPGGEDQTYRTDDRDDLYLAGTSEVPITALHAGSILSHEDLPKRYVAQTTCYRREAGTYGKDTRGIYRVHQFQKIEQVVIDVAEIDRSIEHHAAILQNSEEVLQAFDLPYRVVNVCGGDLGVPHVQKFDIETWMPGRDGYGETHSASRFYDYQSRRLDLRYRGEDGKVRHCHTLNNTVAASTRILIALLENHQVADGRVKVPEALQSYMGGRDLIGRDIRDQ
ncbi:MAG: seryl-tRNA synthetase [Planctomycetota bacterium]